MAIRWRLGGVCVAIIPSDPSMCGSSGLSCTLWMSGDCSSRHKLHCFTHKELSCRSIVGKLLTLNSDQCRLYGPAYKCRDILAVIP